jgi:hypothetical protein
VSRAVDRLRALVAELEAAIAALEQEPAAKPRKRPVVKTETAASPESIEAVRRKLRRKGFAA